ncbi:MAG: FkbM family methyltransferase, partial [Bacteroidales bacterium]
MIAEFFIKLYKDSLPAERRKRIYDLFLGDLLRVKREPRRFFKALALRLRFMLRGPRNEYQKAWSAWADQYGFTAYPYEWIKEYEVDYPVCRDRENALCYVMHGEKRLYIANHLSDAAPLVYKQLLIEQDKRSAHCYLDDFRMLQDQILLDIGAAEGIFTLNALPYVRHAYLFECDERWIEALEATFRPWKDKVTIVRKYIGDKNEGDVITLDRFFENHPEGPVFLKMDIEGAEREALAGAEKLLVSGRLSGSVCVYHRKDDPEIITHHFSSRNISNRIRPGYIYYQ